MIRNVIFDFGQVLVRFDPIFMTEKYISDPEEAQRVAQVVFDRLYWDAIDKGTVSDKEVVDRSCERLGENYREKVTAIYYNWIRNIPEIDGMRELLKKLKTCGIRLFLLSNISTYFADHAGEQEILSYFERCFFSAVCGLTKPNREIFEYLLEECKISPDETIFVDDSQKNIDGAASAGISGYTFDGNVKALENYLFSVISQ